MNNMIKIILIYSIFISLFIGFTTWIILFIKANKIRKSIADENFKKMKIDNGARLVMSRKKVGEPIKELQSMFEDTIDNFSMDYLISIVIRNQYETIWYEGPTEGYEIITIIKKTKAIIFISKKHIKDLNKFNELLSKFRVRKDKIKLVNKKTIKDKFNFIIISEEVEFDNESFDKIWVNISQNGMVILTNCLKLNRKQKTLIKYLKLINIRHEHQKIHAGFMLIAK